MCSLQLDGPRQCDLYGDSMICFGEDGLARLVEWVALS